MWFFFSSKNVRESHRTRLLTLWVHPNQRWADDLSYGTLWIYLHCSHRCSQNVRDSPTTNHSSVRDPILSSQRPADWIVPGKCRGEQLTRVQRVNVHHHRRQPATKSMYNKVHRSISPSRSFCSTTVRKLLPGRGGAKTRPCLCCTWTPRSPPVTDSLPSRRETYWHLNLCLSHQPPWRVGQRAERAHEARSELCATGRASLGDRVRVHCFCLGRTRLRVTQDPNTAITSPVQGRVGGGVGLNEGGGTGTPSLWYFSIC